MITHKHLILVFLECAGIMYFGAYQPKYNVYTF